MNLCLYVVLASLETDPAKIPIPIKGIKTPRQNMNIISGRNLDKSRGTKETKIGAIHGSRK